MDESISVDGIGVLTRTGQSRHWSGAGGASDGHESVDLTIHGTLNGPAPTQAEAVRLVLSRWEEILHEAQEGLSALLNASGMPDDNPWTFFEISGISVPATSYDPAGEVHVHIDLVHVEYPDDFWPAIDIVGGEIREILSGT